MKKIIICATMLIISAHSFSQQITAVKTELTKTEYLKKSKNQRATAWILVGGGTALFITGYLIVANNFADEIVTSVTTGQDDKSTVAGTVMVLTGTAAMLGSIPLFIAAAKNKKRAMKTTTFFKMEKAPVIRQGSFIQNSFPALSLKINQ